MKKPKAQPRVDILSMTPDALTCTVNGVYDYIQRQGRSDKELLALALESYAKQVEEAGK